MRPLQLSIFLFIGVLTGCADATSASEPPHLIHGGWVRQSLEPRTANDVPESVKAVRLEKVWHSKYKGPQDIEALWILYPTPTNAFEALQKIAKGPAIRPFTQGSFLVVMKAEGIPAQALGDFQEGVAKAIH